APCPYATPPCNERIRLPSARFPPDDCPIVQIRRRQTHQRIAPNPFRKIMATQLFLCPQNVSRRFLTMISVYSLKLAPSRILRSAPKTRTKCAFFYSDQVVMIVYGYCLEKPFYLLQNAANQPHRFCIGCICLVMHSDGFKPLRINRNFFNHLFFYSQSQFLEFVRKLITINQVYWWRTISCSFLGGITGKSPSCNK
ncbi:hypothetical protein dsmv_3686, partial [Desulfococcus multivorans DSM 2059]